MYSRVFFIPTILFVYFICSVEARIDLVLNEYSTTLYIFIDDSCAWEGYGPFCDPWIQSIGSQVIVSNSTIESYVTSIITEWTWIGGIKKQGESEYKWYDERSINYTNWADGEPDGGPRNQRSLKNFCIAIDIDGRWHDAPCYYGYHTIRQVDVTPSFVKEFARNVTRRGLSLTSNAMSVIARLRIDNTMSEREHHLSEESQDEIETDIKTMEEHKNITLSDWNQVMANHSNISETMEALKVEVKDIVRLLSDIGFRAIKEELRLSFMSIELDDLITYKEELESKLSQYDSDQERHEHRMNNISSQLEDIESMIESDQHSYHILHGFVFVIVFVSFCLIVLVVYVLRNRNLLYSADKNNSMFRYRSNGCHTNLSEESI